MQRFGPSGRPVVAGLIFKKVLKTEIDLVPGIPYTFRSLEGPGTGEVGMERSAGYSAEAWEATDNGEGWRVVERNGAVHVVDDLGGHAATVYRLSNDHDDRLETAEKLAGTQQMEDALRAVDSWIKHSVADAVEQLIRYDKTSRYEALLYGCDNMRAAIGAVLAKIDRAATARKAKVQQ